MLLAADGIANTRIAELSDATVTTVLNWRGRYQDRGIAGLADASRPGRPRSLDHRQILAETLKPPPKNLGVTHWSSRLLAERLKVSPSAIQRAWRAYGVKPWKAESFRFATDPELIGKVTDIAGLYLAPPQNALVLCVDEKSQTQALDRTVPILPMQEGRIERGSHDYYRHSTSTLFAALDIATGQATAALEHRHRHQEFLAFLKHVERAYRDVLDEAGVPVELHLVMDNYAAHKHKNVREWLAGHPRIVFHSTATHASWMNLVEVWFGIVEHQAIRRGVFKSVKDLNAKIRTFTDAWNDQSHPFVWTKAPDEMPKKTNRPTTSNPRH